MSMSSINNFLAAMNNNLGPAMANRFYINFTLPDELNGSFFGYTNDLQYQCDTSEIPGVNLATTDYRTYGPSKKIATLTEYNSIGFSIYCSNTFWEKPLFDAWIEYINPRNQGWDFRFKDDYATPILVTQLGMGDDDTPIYQVVLLKAFPVAIAPLPVSWSSDSIHQLQVTFVYDKYEIQNTVNNLFGGIFNNSNFLPLAASFNVNASFTLG
jgi:hypothetical protein